MEERLLYEKNANLRNQMKEGISLTKEQHVQKLREEAERLKLEKEEQKRLLSMQMEQE